MPNFKFNREKDAVVPTRDFDHGVIHGTKGQPLSAAEVADLSDAAIRHLVEIAKVASVKNGAAEAEEGDAADAGGIVGSDDAAGKGTVEKGKGATKP